MLTIDAQADLYASHFFHQDASASPVAGVTAARHFAPLPRSGSNSFLSTPLLNFYSRHPSPQPLLPSSSQQQHALSITPHASPDPSCMSCVTLRLFDESSLDYSASANQQGLMRRTTSTMPEADTVPACAAAAAVRLEPYKGSAPLLPQLQIRVSSFDQALQRSLDEVSVSTPPAGWIGNLHIGGASIPPSGSSSPAISSNVTQQQQQFNPATPTTIQQASAEPPQEPVRPHQPQPAAAAAAAEPVAAPADPQSASMKAAWRLLSRHPHLDVEVRKHIQLLDENMERVCNELHNASSEAALRAANGQPLSRASEELRLAEIRAFNERVGMAFCAAGEQVVALYTALAQQAEAEAKAAAAAAAMDESASVEGEADDEEEDAEEHQIKKRRTSASSKDSVSSARSESSSMFTAPKKPKKKRGESEAFSERAVSVLRAWFSAHFDDPYPDASVKFSLAQETGLTYEQVQHWFINARMRMWRPVLKEKAKLIEKQKQEMQGKGKKSKAASPADLSGLTSIAAAASSASAMSVLDACTLASSSHSSAAAGGAVGTKLSPASFASLVPKGGRSYLPAIKQEPTQDTVAAAAASAGAAGAGGDSSSSVTSHCGTPFSSSSMASSSSSTLAEDCSSYGATAELLAASALALSIATSYQTPHSYSGSRAGKIKYKSGGSGGAKKRTATAAATATTSSKTKKQK